MRAADVPAFLAELAGLGVVVQPDGPASLRVRVPRTAVSPAEVARRIRSAKPALLEHFARAAEGEPEGATLPPWRSGPPAWEGAAEIYGPDALPRQHAPPSATVPPDRPHVRPEQVCGGCSRWIPTHPGAEGGSCTAGWAGHDLAPINGMDLPETSRGSRCWAWGGRGWRRATRA